MSAFEGEGVNLLLSFINGSLYLQVEERGWINIRGIMVVRAIGFSSYASETTVYSLRCVEVKETHLLICGSISRC